MNGDGEEPVAVPLGPVLTGFEIGRLQHHNRRSVRPGQGPPGRPPGTRKARCGDQGPAVTWARCSECGETFTGDSGFDKHRINMTGQPGYDPDYDWRCATPAEMEARGYRRNAKGWWCEDARFGRGGRPRADVRAQVGSLGQGAA